MGTGATIKEYKELIENAKKEILSLEGAENISSASIGDIVNIASKVKAEHDYLTKRLESFKEFFKEIGEPGEHFDGTVGYVDLIGRAASTIEPQDLQNILKDMGRESEFLGMITVKVADARKKLGTVIFNKIAETVPNASITVKIGSK